MREKELEMRKKELDGVIYELEDIKKNMRISTKS